MAPSLVPPRSTLWSLARCPTILPTRAAHTTQARALHSAQNTAPCPGMGGTWILLSSPRRPLRAVVQPPAQPAGSPGARVGRGTWGPALLSWSVWRSGLPKGAGDSGMQARCGLKGVAGTQENTSHWKPAASDGRALP